MFGGNMPSLADIAAVTDGNRNGGNCNDGMFGNGAWWIIVILLVIFGAFNGYGTNGNRGASDNGGGTTVVYDTGASLQRGFDTSAITTKLDNLGGTITSAVCDLGYDQLAQMNGINSNIMQASFGIQQAINNDTVANMQNTNAIMTQAADCCCKTQTAFMNVINQMDKNNCATNTNIHQTGDAIIQNQNNGFQMLNNTIKDGFANIEKQQLMRENADLRQRLNNCDRDSALQGTASYIINSVRPTPIPSWNVQNPWSNCNCSNNYNDCRNC